MLLIVVLYLFQIHPYHLCHLIMHHLKLMLQRQLQILATQIYPNHNHMIVTGKLCFPVTIGRCSDDERWKKDDKYAVMGSGKRAIRVLNSLEEAEEYSSALDQKTRVEHRVGESTRCIQNWCNVNEWCDQFQGGNV